MSSTGGNPEYSLENIKTGFKTFLRGEARRLALVPYLTGVVERVAKETEVILYVFGMGDLFRPDGIGHVDEYRKFVSERNGISGPISQDFYDSCCDYIESLRTSRAHRDFDLAVVVENCTKDEKSEIVETLVEQLNGEYSRIIHELHCDRLLDPVHVSSFNGFDYRTDCTWTQDEFYGFLINGGESKKLKKQIKDLFDGIGFTIINRCVDPEIDEKLNSVRELGVLRPMEEYWQEVYIPYAEKVLDVFSGGNGIKDLVLRSIEMAKSRTGACDLQG